MKPIFQAHTCLTEAEIKRYLDEKLTPEERFRVENHLLDCPLCEEAVEGQMLLRQTPSSRLLPLKRTRWVLRAAASLLLLVLAGWLLQKTTSKSTPSRLFAAHHEVYPVEVLTLMRGLNDPAASPDAEKAMLVEALKAYEQKNYQSSTQQLHAYLSGHPEDLIARFYLGLALLESNDAPAALQAFDQVIATEGLYVEEARWYRALALLKQNEKEQTQKQLQEIISEGKSRYLQQAQDLLRKL